MAWTIPPTDVARGRQPECAVTVAAIADRPWYASLSATISLRPVATHAIISAVSIASVPEFVKKVRWSAPGAMSAIFRAASTCASVAYNVET